jgi:RecB family exonuclease
VVVDIKTGSTRPADDELTGHPQLGVYQLAVQRGAFAALDISEAGGAELVQVGTGGFSDRVRRQIQPALTDAPDPNWAATLVDRVAAGMAAAAFPATIGDHCRTCALIGCCPVQPEGRPVGVTP